VKFLTNREVMDNLPSTQTVLDGISDPRQLPKHFLEVTKGRSQERRYKNLRLSEIDKACPREWVLGHCLDLYYMDNAPFPNVWQMDMGSVLHRHIQNASNYFGDKLVGWWQCLACGNVRRFGVRPTEPCEKCHAHPRVTEYYEYMFRLSKPYRVVGKIDLILRVAPRVYRFGEIKTVSKDVENPDGAHVAQVLSYNFFSKYDDKLPITIDRSVAYIFYFNKIFNFKGTVKTFKVQPTDRNIGPLKAKARAITEGVDNRTLPDPLLPCIKTNFSKNSGRARSCGIPGDCKKYFEMDTKQI
jgi:hypothetical protein